jgi:ABC-type sulfate transport system permease component
VEVAAIPAPRRRRRLPGWAIASAAVALIVAGPLAALPLSFITDRGAFSEIADSLLGEALWASLVLALGVGAGTLVLGGALAALVSFYDFPGRRWLDWALVLPLAMPAYVLVFVLLGQYDEAGPLQSALRAVLGDGFQLPQVRSTAGAIVVLTLVLYPYVYVLGRGAFLEQSRDTMEAARTLGLSHGAAVRRVALPLARPGAGGRRRARGDGGAGRLRSRQPPQLPRDDRRDLPRLVRPFDQAGRSSWPRCSAHVGLALERLLRVGPATTARSRAARPSCRAACAGAARGLARPRALLAARARRPGQLAPLVAGR